jgi:predicted permease
MPEWSQEFRYSVRVLSKSPGFVAVCVFSLALGIGVNTAVLSVGRALLLAPLPVPEPERLAIAYWWRADPIVGVTQYATGGAKDERTGRKLNSNYDHPTYRALRESVRERADLFAFSFIRQANVALDGHGQAGGAMLVSGNYFAALRVPMHLGRGIGDADDQPNAPPVAVVSFGMWRRAFGGDPSVVGKIVRVNGVACTLVGVAGREYFGLSSGGSFAPADVSLPLAAQPLVQRQWTASDGTLFTSERTQWLQLMARLKPGVDRAALQSAMAAAFADRLRSSSFPVAAGVEPPVIMLLDGARGLGTLDTSTRQPLLLLGSVAVLVFLLACLNIAALVLLRGVARRREFWIRLALGAGRARLVRQTAIESLLLAITGGLLGALLASWIGPALVSMLAGATQAAVSVRPGLALIAVATGLSALAAVLSGVLPALWLARRDDPTQMRHGANGLSMPRLRAGHTLVLVQVAAAVPLVFGAALFLRTAHNLAGVELGFQARGLVVFKMDPTLNGYDPVRGRDLFRRVSERVSAIEGVRHVTLVENVLISRWKSQSSFSVDGVRPRTLMVNRVGPGFFETMGLPIIAGRGVGEEDTDRSEPVAVINDVAARALFPGQNPVGRQLVMSGRKPVTLEIVGVARDALYTTLKEGPGSTVYLPNFQNAGTGAMNVVARTIDEQQVLRGLPNAVAEVSKNVPMAGARTQTQQIEGTIGNERA